MLELLISIGIFTLITGAILANFRGGERQEEFRLGVENVRSILEKARTMTLTGQVTTYTNGGTPKTGVPLGGYGVEITQDFQTKRFRYRFVAIDAAPGSGTYEESSSVWYVGKFQPENFPASLSVTPLSNVSDIFTMVTFEPPSGTIVFRTQGGRIIDKEASLRGQVIDIRHEALSGTYKRIKLDRLSGRISIE